jgi:hypothetical protein
MQTEKFIQLIVDEVVEGNTSLYRRFYTSQLPNPATDEDFMVRHELINRINPNDQAVVFGMMRQATIDAISKLFGVLDGSSTIGDSVLNVQILSEDGELMNGDLQDMFLEHIENVD